MIFFQRSGKKQVLIKKELEDFGRHLGLGILFHGLGLKQSVVCQGLAFWDTLRGMRVGSLVSCWWLTLRM